MDKVDGVNEGALRTAVVKQLFDDDTAASTDSFAIQIIQKEVD